MIMKTIEFLWWYWNMCWLLTRLRPGGKPRMRPTRVCASNLVVWPLPVVEENRTLDFELWTCELSDRGCWLREREPTWDNVWEPCVQGDRSHQKPHARRVFILHNMQTPLDFNSVDFLGMLEVLGLQLIFMHRGNWRDFIWSYYCAFVSWWYCDGMTHWLYDVLIVCLLFCWLRPMYSSRHTKVNAIPL